MVEHVKSRLFLNKFPPQNVHDLCCQIGNYGVEFYVVDTCCIVLKACYFGTKFHHEMVGTITANWRFRDNLNPN
jgi:hypothetical protein